MVGVGSRLAASDQLVEEVAALFRLGVVKGWHDLGGSRTTNLLIMNAASARVVARVHQQATSADRLAAEQAARIVLSEAGVATVVPLADADGRTAERLSSGRLVEVEHYVPWTRRMSTAPLLRVGFAQLSRIHDVLRTANLPTAAAEAQHANHIDAGAALAATRRGAERIRQWDDQELTRYADGAQALAERVAAAEQRYRDEQLVQIVHGDFWDNNVLFDDAGLAAVLDFGFMARRPRVDDLALPVWFYLNEPDRKLPGAADLALVRDLLDAYDATATRPLSAAERASLPLAVARQPGWSIGGWVLHLDDGQARRHASESAAELRVAEAILHDLDEWQEALTSTALTAEQHQLGAGAESLPGSPVKSW